MVRDVELCPRAIAVLKRQRTLTGLKGEHVFGHDTGEGRPDMHPTRKGKQWYFGTRAHTYNGLRPGMTSPNTGWWDFDDRIGPSRVFTYSCCQHAPSHPI